MTDKEFQVITAMKVYGGGFVQALSECFMRADHINFSRLKTAFAEYWELYEGMSNEKSQS